MKARKQMPFAFGAPGGPRVSHLLLVAGPSGAGKSTFLKKLAAGDLPHEIAAALPAEAGSWMQTNGIKVVRKGGGRVHRHGGRISGLVLHYDIMRPWQSPIADYGDDRSLAALSAADAITMVELRPDPASLAAQLTARARGGHTAEEWAARLRKRFARGASVGGAENFAARVQRRCIARRGFPPEGASRRARPALRRARIPRRMVCSLRGVRRRRRRQCGPAAHRPGRARLGRRPPGIVPTDRRAGKIAQGELKRCRPSFA